MKKLLLGVISVLAIAGIVNGQSEGYNWYFGAAAPYNSNAAIAGSPGSYQLTTVGTGSMTIATGENVGLGPSCSGPIDVGQFTKPFGLVFSNSPQIVTGTYTLELSVNITDLTTYVRLLGFSGTDDGIYIAPGGTAIDFVVAGNNNIATTINAGTWVDLVFVRDAATKDINFYQDGLLIGTFNDATDALIPQAGNGNTITFLKDEVDNTEEGDGKLAKISIYNRKLSPIEIGTSFNNICNPAYQFIPPNFAPQGYQWTFASAPYNSAPADGASAGNYPLSTIGSGSIVTAPGVSVGLGLGCTGPIDVGQFTKPVGLELNNSPQFVAGTYSIELVVNVDDVTNAVRLVDFSGGASDDGIYIDAGGGAIDLVVGGVPTFVSPIIISANTWYQFLFIRDGATKNITVYQNGVLIGTPFNDATDALIPQEANNYNISFLKDDVDLLEEGSGLIAKAAVFNKVLSAPQIQERFDNICNSNLIILPVTLKNFIAKKDGSKVDLSWITSSEQNNRGFEIQRSNNGSAYTTIGFVPGVGNTSSEVKYQFTDPAPLPGKNYYRLKQIGIDNRASLSAIRILDMSKELQDLQVYPNPSHNLLTILNIKAGNLLYVYDSQGRSVLSRRATNNQESIAVDKLSSGLYILQVTDSDGSKRSIRFTKF